MGNCKATCQNDDTYSVKYDETSNNSNNNSINKRYNNNDDDNNKQYTRSNNSKRDRNFNLNIKTENTSQNSISQKKSKLVLLKQEHKNNHKESNYTSNNERLDKIDMSVILKSESHEENEDDKSIKNSISNINSTRQTGNLELRNKHNKLKVKVRKIENTYDESVNLTTILPKNSNFDDPKLIEKGMNKHFFMQNLERITKKEIIKRMCLSFTEEGRQIIQEGKIGTYFYIIKKGEVRVRNKSGSIDKVLREGDSFGELALLHQNERQYSVYAKTDIFLWCLSRKTFKKITDHVNKLQYEENKNFLDSINCLKSIESEQKNILSLNFTKDYYEIGSFICKKGDQANCLYIIKEGEINCVSNGKTIRVLEKGSLFGEKAILIDSKRTIDCVAKTNCILLSLSILALQQVMGEDFRDKIFLSFIKESLVHSNSLRALNSHLIEKLFPFFRASNFGFGQEVFKSGYKISSKLVVVIEGSLIASTTKELVCNRGKILFEEDVFNNTDRILEYSVIAQPDCLLMEVDVEVITRELGGSLSAIGQRSGLLSCLQKVSLFRTLTHSKIESIGKCITEESFLNGVDIVTEGEEGSKFYIIKSGRVDIFVKGNYIRSLNENEYFGERALLLNETRKASCTSNGDVQCYVLDKLNFKEKIESNLKDFLISRIYLQDNTIQLTDLEFIQELGHGSFGDVLLVYSKKNNYYYALKGIQKKQIDIEQLHQSIEQEKNILLKIDHPFIVKMVKTLKDSKNIFFLMEYVKGKELFDIMNELGSMTLYQTKYFSASIFSAIDYLHKRNLIYRDVKPENVLVNEYGLVKLIDFGTCKEISERTNTVIGTPHYMAPEVVLGEGYTSIVDIWSVAICLYEFVTGSVPFGELAEEPIDVYLAIINDEVNFPSSIKDFNFKDLIKKLLAKSASSRLSNVSIIFEHAYYKDFNVEQLISLNLEPAYIPKTKDPQNFKPIPLKKYLDSNTKIYDNSDIDTKIDSQVQVEYDKWFHNF